MNDHEKEQLWADIKDLLVENRVYGEINDALIADTLATWDDDWHPVYGDMQDYIGCTIAAMHDTPCAKAGWG